MGPAVPLIFMIIVGTPLFAGLFCLFRFKYSTRSAFALAIIFAGGAGAGVVIAALLAMLTIGFEPTLRSQLAVIFYLGWLATGALAGGVTSVRWIRQRWHLT